MLKKQPKHKRGGSGKGLKYVQSPRVRIGTDRQQHTLRDSSSFIVSVVSWIGNRGFVDCSLSNSICQCLTPGVPIFSRHMALSTVEHFLRVFTLPKRTIAGAEYHGLQVYYRGPWPRSTESCHSGYACSHWTPSGTIWPFSAVTAICAVNTGHQYRVDATSSELGCLHSYTPDIGPKESCPVSSLLGLWAILGDCIVMQISVIQ
ncbi:hypothetical protein FIBSPDRAFT_884792 [Athelia psychrophila]|uniref:Uncharacterized protein n=1 Tax=Athelia psychrophila TaxID=1759441 RepID=A0A166SSB9_9AGAM|nr:hypothetical protein FIBSPDRAFT_884792 [Fibularhizoctonia sp. CBS 109695]